MNSNFNVKNDNNYKESFNYKDLTKKEKAKYRKQQQRVRDKAMKPANPERLAKLQEEQEKKNLRQAERKKLMEQRNKQTQQRISSTSSIKSSSTQETPTSSTPSTLKRNQPQMEPTTTKPKMGRAKIVRTKEEIRYNAKMRKRRQVERDRNMKPFKPERLAKLQEEVKVKAEKDRIRKSLNHEKLQKKLREDEEKRVGRFKRRINRINRLYARVIKERKKRQKLIDAMEPRLTKTFGENNRSKLYSIPGQNFQDPKLFLDLSTQVVMDLINSIPGSKKVNAVLKLILVKIDYEDEWVEEVDEFGFRSGTHYVLTEEDIAERYQTMMSKMLENLSSHQKKSSGWVVRSVVKLDVSVTQFDPLLGKGHQKLPKIVDDKKAIINPQNKGSLCFLYSVAIGELLQRDPTLTHLEKVRTNVRLQTRKYDCEGIDFPVKIKAISKFEKLNSISINVFSWDDEIEKVIPLQLSRTKFKKQVNLFWWNDHFSTIKSMDRLLNNQFKNSKNGKYFCFHCTNPFTSKEKLNKHVEFCKDHEAQVQQYPTPNNFGSTMKWGKKDFRKTQDVPIVIVVDFEAMLAPLKDDGQKDEKKSYTHKYQKHIASGYCYKVISMDENIYPGETVSYTKRYENENIGKLCLSSIEGKVKELWNKYLKTPKPIIISEEEEKEYQEATSCYVCGGPFFPYSNKDLECKSERMIEKIKAEKKVRDHNHFNGKYRGPAHNSCNLGMKSARHIPILAHNMSGYDGHHLIPNLGETNGKLSGIAINEEKYISFSKKIFMDAGWKKELEKDGEPKKKWVMVEMRFIDFYKFMGSSLSTLVENLDDSDFNLTEKEFKDHPKENVDLLKQKGVFPYEFLTSLKRLDYPKLPPKEKFYSKLNGSGISDKEYNHAQKVWKTFKCKTLRDYHNLYLKTDVTLLADVVQKFRKTCHKTYGLDPLWYYTAPGLAWDALLKMSKQELELLTDPDIYLMIERCIRGGISTITHRHSEANNTYMEDYDQSKEDSFIVYLDENNLYGVPMTSPLPVGGFRWMDEKEMNDWKKMLNKKGKGCFLEVDLKYPKDLHDLHNDFPFAAERLKVNGVEKLIPNFNDKKNYVVHYEALNQMLNHGLVLEKIHRGVSFTEKAWMKSYIMMNTELRKNAKNAFEKDFFKLMNNSVYGKTMENVRNRVDLRFVNDETQLEKLVKKPNFESINILDDFLGIVKMKKTHVKLNKPIFVGAAILDKSKMEMYKFHYDYIKPKYGEKAKLLFTDTDSFCYEIKTKDFFKDISGDVEKMFDTSNFPDSHSSGIPCGKNKKVLGMMKSETGANMIDGFVGLRSKLYAIKIKEKKKTGLIEEKEEKRCKGVKKCVIENEIRFQDYVECLKTGKNLMRGMNTFRSKNHQIFTTHVNKIALNPDDDKRVILADGISTLAIGHWRTKETFFEPFKKGEHLTFSEKPKPHHKKIEQLKEERLQPIHKNVERMKTEKMVDKPHPKNIENINPNSVFEIFEDEDERPVGRMLRRR